MKRFILFVLVAGLPAITALAQISSDAIVGEWLSPKKDSRILIYQQGSKYYGKITWGKGGASKDERNPNQALRNRDVVGLVILQDFSYNGDGTWQNGTIYDPREGKRTLVK